ncbi:hypothetical protein Tco_0161281, partial [Tanacetum coccineum]
MAEIMIGHNNLHESDCKFISNEWILDSYDVEEEYAREIGDLYFRRFNKYNRVFKNKIEHLLNEYSLRIEKKGYVLDDVWENVNKTTRKSMSMARRGIRGGRNVANWGREDRLQSPLSLPLGRVNGAHFKAMIRKELEGNKYVHEITLEDK